jgi:hypothetical protein
MSMGAPTSAGSNGELLFVKGDMGLSKPEAFEKAKLQTIVNPAGGGTVGTYFVLDPTHMVGDTVNVPVVHGSCIDDVNSNMQRAFVKVKEEGGFRGSRHGRGLCATLSLMV